MLRLIRDKQGVCSSRAYINVSFFNCHFYLPHWADQAVRLLEDVRQSLGWELRQLISISPWPQSHTPPHHCEWQVVRMETEHGPLVCRQPYNPKPHPGCGLPGSWRGWEATMQSPATGDICRHTPKQGLFGRHYLSNEHSETRCIRIDRSVWSSGKICVGDTYRTVSLSSWPVRVNTSGVIQFWTGGSCSWKRQEESP